MEPIDKQHFWNNKILKWEKDKYSIPKSKLGRFFDVNQSLKKRQQIAKNILKHNVRGRTILEIGCGTARLLHSIFEAGATKYIGIDISKKAVQAGQKNAKELKVERFAEFYQLDKSLIEKVDSTTFTQPAKRPAKTGFIIEKAHLELGYIPHTFTEGLTILSKQL